ncbi:trypsin-like serine protease [Conidiobolus coronatus NRRL 28638]|uniref:Trypsin-like serine protease n=1 Tax=Conidiobolus coronatus (strain ATCC 28846 / CBS 209.66 / NRRL 28638) TaxID=796925 RepID=A0A137PHF6_CONC2|nr:trypsin-like serine protease [Conidiobolus coronatus NRRL 28638]|eukprot:KXN74420.1 trypsin-like serine protease [Conidiobolus coronatus NRRL 28638]
MPPHISSWRFYLLLHTFLCNFFSVHSRIISNQSINRSLKPEKIAAKNAKPTLSTPEPSISEFGVGETVLTPNVIGGSEVKPEFAYPWMASLQWKGNHVCGGTLYGNNMVITAAHCSSGDINQFTVVLHRHNLGRSLMEEQAMVFKVSQRYVHEQYNPLSNFNDVALWKLEGSYPNPTKSIILDDGKHADAAKSLFGIGWGRTRVDGPLSPVLMQVELPITAYEECSNVMKEQGYSISNELQICAGTQQGGKDTCQGDSGGPLIYSNDNQHILVGITSFGISCAQPGLPGVYTRITGVSNWIASKAKLIQSSKR